MRRLLGRANSSNVMKVICLLEHLGLPYEREDAGGAFGRTRDPDYLAMNPNAVVPTFIEDDFVLWESNVILRYIAAGHAADTPLWPESLRARANIDRWMDWQQTTLGPPMTPVFWGLVRTPPEQQDWPVIHANAGKLAQVYTILDTLLARHPFIAGADFTPADIAIGAHAHRYMSFERIEKPTLPNLRAWYERLLAIPAYKAYIAIKMT